MRQIDYVAFLMKDEVVIEKHIIRMPAYGDKGWYKSVVSVDAFRSREAQRLYDHHSAGNRVFGLLSNVFRLEEWEHDTEITSKSMKEVCDIDYVHPYNLVPVVEHKNLFDFYTHVGYDYKKKRYI